MRRRVSLGLTAFVLALSWLVSLPMAATAQVSFVTPSTPAASAPTTPVAPEIGSLLDRGRALEVERRWGEALTFYEDALKQYPQETSLEQRFGLARLHYDLGRRYSDNSFHDSVRQLDSREALEVYADVLLKIQSHYVHAPNWKQLVDHGTTAVEVALGDGQFVEHNLRDVPPAQIEKFRRELRSRLDVRNPQRAIDSRLAARDIVGQAGDIARQQLGINPTAVILEYVCGATNSLDPYSTYLTAGQLNEVYSQIEGNFVGLGVELKAADNSLLIVKVITGSPAERGGIKAGDRIVAVDGRSTREMSTDQAANMLQGKEGSIVEITAVGPGQAPRNMRIRREQVEVPSVDDVKIVDPAFGVGYFKLTCFQKTTSRDLDAALWKLHNQGMKSLIIDLRGNPGGLLTTSVDVVDKFVERGVIVSTRGRSPNEDYNYSAHTQGTWRVPLVVLIDGDSASASEIFAGAIRDHRRGTIVGSRSYGKGSVQGIFPLNIGGTGVRLTTAKFYSPNGRPYSLVGVSPDVTVQQAAKPIADGAAAGTVPTPAGDAALDAALGEARRQLARR